MKTKQEPKNEELNAVITPRLTQARPLMHGWLRETNSTRERANLHPRPLLIVFAWAVLAAGIFHAAYLASLAAPLVVFYLFCLLQIAHSDKWRMAFYPGLLTGLLIAAGRLEFFWTIFSGGAMALWLVFAFWLGLFCALARLCFLHIPRPACWFAIPFVWTGLEYFRSELYYLRFAWLSPGLAFADGNAMPILSFAGTYGTGFLVAAIACAADAAAVYSIWRGWLAATVGAGLCEIASLIGVPAWREPETRLRIVGVQMEFPTEKEVLVRLDEAVRREPEAELIVLPEYTFTEPIPAKVREWCRRAARYLLVCGKAPAPNGNFYNTAFIINPAGEIVFEQVKAVPIQFFKDGLPANTQALWNSPWGKLGICICYDLSYTRVTDELVRQGARAFLVPTMDVADWGARQHRLHARIAPARAAEYGIPIVRIASSGISQFVTATGQVTTAAPFPSPGEIVAADVELRGTGSVLWDRGLAVVSVGITGILSLLCATRRRLGRNIEAAAPAVAG